MKIGLPDEAIAAKYLVKTHYVVRVLEFHPEDQTVDVIQDTFDFTNTPLGEISVKNEFGQEVTVGLLEPSILYGVPVQQLRWGQFSIQACPKKDDTGYIEVFTTDISAWKKDGGISVPPSDRRFPKESCVFVPFIANQKNKTENYINNENTLVIKSANASITLTDDGSTSSVAIVSKTMTVTAEDGVSITGDVSVEGKINATDEIKSDTDVKAGQNEISLTGHTHNYTMPQHPASQGPTTSPNTGA